MPGRHDKVMPETSGDDGSTSGSEVSIGEEGDDNNRLTAESDDSDEEEAESSDEDESSESDSSDSGDESSSDDSDSSDSLWGVFDDDDKKETQEANEASALQEFQSALDYLVEGKNAMASKILNKLLNNPLVKVFLTTVFDWEAEVDERLSKMARLFVGIHKNLAKLDTENAAEHFLQILSVAPKNPEVWLNLGVECIGKGDVDFAKFAFDHAEGKEATDALLSALYLSPCLRLAHKCLSMGVCEQKSLFLKERIRSINHHYSEFCDYVFGEHRRYDIVKVLDEETTKKMAQRLAAVEERINSSTNETIFAPPDPIDISIDAEQTVIDVGTVFCDLFDRIESYSSLSLQEVKFSSWDDRRDLLTSENVLEGIVDIVETIEFLVNQVSSHSGRTHHRSFLHASSLLSGSSDCFLRRSMRNAMELPFEEEESRPDTETSTTCRLDGNLPTVELAQSLGFVVNYVLPLKSELTKRPSRVPTPEFTKFMDTDELLFLLMTTLREGSEPHARDYCIRWHCSKRWDDKELMQRFMWSHTKAVTDERIRLSFLKFLYDSLDDEVFVFTAKGFFGKDDVQDSIERLERSIRIVSISQLRSCSRYEEVIAIITKDVDFNSMDDWNVWKELYMVVRRLNGEASVEYIQSLDPIKHDDSLPSLALDVLVKAHEKLGEKKACGRDNGAFLLFFMEQLYACILNEKVMAVLQREEHSWVWSNVSEEISQCLYCLFGRYSKRRRALEDHDCIVTSPELDKHSTMILELAMPHPLPQYDDKERLGHDVVDLLLNKFPSVLKYSAERGNVLDKFNVWMHEASRETATSGHILSGVEEAH
ncbi:hypothetical protein ANCDUO_02249 [Ancylostoma duodenale]|uniref:Tetratricopeptide repeat protein n=1 Tax=Ancylostoma duodenale TaxID=51022 RepID=A0A0C2H100_9BILA|nr:hypothetical protein ANCDUO_02249 [Ancylostoma duodenale]